MRRIRMTGRYRAALITAVMILALPAVWTAGATQGYSDGRLWLVNEPDGQSSYVRYYGEDGEKSAADMTWTEDGHTGKALLLSGGGDYLEIGYWQLQMHTMTFSGWFNWQGAARGMDEESMYSQRLFTMSRNDDIWLTVMPHVKDESRTDEDGKSIDGVYMAFSMGEGETKVHYEFWNPAEAGRESYGLRAGRWHHVAMTMDGQSLKLYIDGRLWFERMLVLGVEEMRNNWLAVGSGRWGDPTLHALVDDMAVYDFAMSPDQIVMLSRDIDPLDENASLPAETTPSLPTGTTPQPSATEPSRTDPSFFEETGLFGLPVWILWLAGIQVFFAVTVSVAVNLYRPLPPRGKDGEDEGGKQP